MKMMSFNSKFPMPTLNRQQKTVATLQMPSRMGCAPLWIFVPVLSNGYGHMQDMSVLPPIATEKAASMSTLPPPKADMCSALVGVR